MNVGEKKNGGGCISFFLIWAIGALVIGFWLHSINETKQGTDALVVTSAAIGFLVALVVSSMRMVVMTSKAKKLARQQRGLDKANGITRFNNMIHVGGLEAPENCKCTATLSEGGLTIACGGNEFLLRLDKIRNVDFQLDIDEKQYLKSSMAKGIAGAAMFGISGAVIGSAPKTKTKREVKCYAIIAYERTDGQFKTFILKDEIANLSRCSKLVETLKPMIQVQTNKVEL